MRGCGHRQKERQGNGMAERRMFTKKVTDDDNFMSLSSSAQALYLHLSMSADDDGFSNQVSISMFKAHASVQDLQALLEKRYIYQFENGVIVIKHWRMANALRKDRYTPTAFKEELALLDVKKNGAYTMSSNMIPSNIDEMDENEENLTPRKLAYKRSTLPYSFDYKIKSAFYGKICPVCGFAMQKSIDEAGVISENRLPTIQHNKPVSQGGEHELGNISVICHQCNVSIQDTETGELNAQEVIDIWEQINGCRLVAKCLPQDSIGKDSKGKESIDIPDSDELDTSVSKKKTVKHKYGEYNHVLLTDAEYEKLCKEYGEGVAKSAITYLDEAIEMKGYKYKSHYLAIRKWVIEAVTKGNKTVKNNGYGGQDLNDLDEFFK